MDLRANLDGLERERDYYFRPIWATLLGSCVCMLYCTMYHTNYTILYYTILTILNNIVCVSVLFICILTSLISILINVHTVPVTIIAVTYLGSCVCVCVYSYP